MSPRLALGTVQFGLQYGIANSTGQVTREEAGAILTQALASGFDTLDTAIGYGDSERRLGDIGVAGWKVVSKLPSIPADCGQVTQWAHDAVDGTLVRLGIPRLYGLLMHNSHDLRGARGGELRRALQSVRDSGKAEKIGVSIYDPAELDELTAGGSLDLVQAPYNLIDRRLANSGWLDRLASDGTEIHVRSTFLQGLLLMAPGERPARFRRWQPLWSEFARWLEKHGLTPLEACLGFVLAQPLIDRVVVGVDSERQLREILATLHRGPVALPAALASDDPDLINPSRWSLN